MAFIINNNLVFIDSMQFMNSSLDALVKNLSDNDFKYLSQEFSGDLLGLIKQNGVYPYNLWTALKSLLKINYQANTNFLVLKMTILLKMSILVQKTTQHLLMFRMLSK